jgi:hypothetical protein
MEGFMTRRRTVLAAAIATSALLFAAQSMANNGAS